MLTQWSCSAQESEGSTVVYISRGITLNWIQLPYVQGYIACKGDVVSNSVHPGEATLRPLVCHQWQGVKQITTGYPKSHSKPDPQSFKITRFLLNQIPDVWWYKYPYSISVNFNKRPKFMFEKYSQQGYQECYWLSSNHPWQFVLLHTLLSPF